MDEYECLLLTILDERPRQVDEHENIYVKITKEDLMGIIEALKE